MGIVLTNEEYPHTAVITRVTTTETPPFSSSTATVWSGVVDCQVNNGGGTSEKQSVFVSDYIIYSACISSELRTGDIITVTFKVGGTPVKCTIEQSTTENVWEVDGVAYGTTIWANQKRN